MLGTALTSAKKGRLRPSFFLLSTVLVPALAQQAVYRCGQQYTNLPQDAGRCERLAPQAVTVIEGTRVQGRGAVSAPLPAAVPQGTATARVEPAGQKQRDDMARTIVSAELGQARQRFAELQQQHQKAQTMPSPDAARVVQLGAALDRAQRDIDSLQRELDRRPTKTP